MSARGRMKRQSIRSLRPVEVGDLVEVGSHRYHVNKFGRAAKAGGGFFEIAELRERDDTGDPEFLTADYLEQHGRYVIGPEGEPVREGVGDDGTD